MTTSGKTTLAIRLASFERARGYSVFVLDPLKDKRWQADLITSSTKQFMKSATQSRNCSLFLDESGETVGRYNEEMFWLATRARHFGHVSHFISQRATQLAPLVRDQCSHLFLFRVSNPDAKVLADSWSNESLLEASKLDKFHFIYLQRFGKASRYILTRNGVATYESGNAIGVRNSSLLIN